MRVSCRGANEPGMPLGNNGTNTIEGDWVDIQFAFLEQATSHSTVCATLLVSFPA